MNQSVNSGWIKHGDFIMIDMLALHLSFVIAWLMRFGIVNVYANHHFVSMSMVYCLINLVVCFYLDSYKNVLKRGLWIEFTYTLKQNIFTFLLASFMMFAVLRQGAYSRMVLLVTTLLYFPLGYLIRLLWKEAVLHLVPAKQNKMLIITTSISAEQVVKRIMENDLNQHDVTGIAIADKDMTGTEIQGVRVVCAPDEILQYALREWVDEVFIDFAAKEPAYDALIDGFSQMGTTIHVNLSNMTDMGSMEQKVEKLASYTVLTASMKIATPMQVFMKRAMDIAGGLVGCAIMLVLLLFVGPAIMILSPGPIFFKQTRIGRNGKKFKVYKFRSMYIDAEERKAELMSKNKIADGMMFKMDYDPRIIGSEKGQGKGFGNFIRKYSIDEFPQFINVLKGDMSLVGTRPPTVDEWEKYELHHRARLAIKPGITGMWQVSGRSNILNFEEVVRLDTTYIKNWSIGLDIKILLKTLLVVFKREGAM